MLLDEGQRVILVDATDDEIVACLELQDVQRIDTYLSSSAVGV